MRARARQNPAGDFVHEHPWMTFFLGLAAINTVGWLAVAGIAAAQGTSKSGPSYTQQNAVPVPAGAPLVATVGSSLQMVNAGVAVSATTSNAAVLAPAPGVVGGFVAIAPGIATVTAGGLTSVITVVVSSTGTAGVGAPRRPPLSILFGVRPRRLAA